MELSHVMSELVSGESVHPNVNRETSLRIRMTDAFSLFVCLAILVKNRRRIINDRLDFVSLSMMLNNQAESQSLSQILKIARQLHQAYYSYQVTHFDAMIDPPSSEQDRDVRMFDMWLDDPSVLNRP